MKNLSCILFSVAIMLASSIKTFAGPPAAPSGQKWVAVNELSDEFNGLDGNKWMRGHPYWAGRAPSQYNNNNVTFGSGLMRLQMTVKDAGMKGTWIWASCLTSRTKAFKKGMYAECQLKVANLSAVSAFWMQSSYAEIDVIENWGTVKNGTYRYLDYTMMSNTHYFPNGWGSDKNTPKHYTNPGNARNANSYWTYGVWWKDSRNILFYRNGAYVGSAYTAGGFEESMYMFFDMEPFTWGPGLPSVQDLYNAGLNSAYYNYVHTYRLAAKSAEDEMLSLGALTAYPNPTTEQLFVSGIAKGVYSAKIFDMQGKQIISFQLNVDGQVAQINVNNLPQGAYIAKIFGGTTDKTIKFIKE